MNYSNHEMQQELKAALKFIPTHKEISVSNYLENLWILYFRYQNEVELNIKVSDSANATILYLAKMKVEFEGLLMLFESSFELVLFPNDTLICIRGDEKTNTYRKAHLKIYKQVISFLTIQIDTLKFLVKHRLYPEIIKILPSKYILDKSKVNIIDIVEFALALYNLDFFDKRDGGYKQLYEFIQDVGRCFGEEISNIGSRIRELKQRNNQKSKFLNKMIHSYTRAIDLENNSQI